MTITKLTGDPVESTKHSAGASHVEAESRSLQDEDDDSVASHSHTCNGHGHDHSNLFGQRTEIAFAALAGITLIVGWVLENLAAAPPAVFVTVYVASFFFGGFFAVREAAASLKHGRFEIDFLMIVAALGAAWLGALAEGALLLFLFSLGHAAEHYAMGRARDAIESLAKLAPRTARVLRNGVYVELSTKELVVGDQVTIKPDERIPVDGFVVAGESSVDQSPITGESIPVDKSPVLDNESAIARPDLLEPKYRVYAGTINQSGSLEVRVTKLSKDSTLARVTKMVNEAKLHVSPTQHFTKRFEKVFVPIVITFVLLLLLTPLVIEESFKTAFYRAMAVLVAASPCALAISTPSAVLSSIARAARGGVLVKGGGPMETLGRIDTIAFDKTGTLTEGIPKIVSINPLEGFTERELVENAIAVEQLSSHPIAKSIVRDGNAWLHEHHGLEPMDGNVEHFQSFAGRGAEAEFQGARIRVGKLEFFKSDNEDDVRAAAKLVSRLELQGQTTVLVQKDSRFVGVIGLMDQPRPEAKRTIQRIRDLGVRRMIMISGDNQTVADAVAKEVGLDKAMGGLLPEDKVAAIGMMKSDAGVAVLGDGVNDAPAMAASSVGIAMGGAANDVALETADIALLNDDLQNLPLAIGLSRATTRTIRQNLWISLGMVAFLVPATLLGLSIGPAVFLHEGSTVLVVLNALRLLGYKDTTA